MSHHLTAVDRSLAYADNQQTLTISRSYPTTIEDLWDACTNAERIPRWFLPIEGDLEVGGRYQLAGNAGGVIESCDAPREFKATWEFAGDVSWITVSVAEDGDGARFTLKHVASTDNPHWEQHGPAAVGMGWDGMLHGLGLHIDSGQPIDPQWAAEWLVSEEAKQFNARSGELWLAADQEAGTPEADARRRIDATVKAFSGQE